MATSDFRTFKDAKRYIVFFNWNGCPFTCFEFYDIKLESIYICCTIFSTVQLSMNMGGGGGVTICFIKT